MNSYHRTNTVEIPQEYRRKSEFGTAISKGNKRYVDNEIKKNSFLIYILKLSGEVFLIIDVRIVIKGISTFKSSSGIKTAAG